MQVFFIILLFSNTLTSVVLTDALSSAASKRPNFVFILTDDQDILFDSMEKGMPITNKIMTEQGIKFTNTFVATPVCCPSRAETISGRFLQNVRLSNDSLNNCMNVAAQYNVFNNSKSMFQILSQNGYLTASIGKLTNDLENYWCNAGDLPLLSGFNRISAPCDNENNFYEPRWFDLYHNGSIGQTNYSLIPSNYKTSLEGNQSIAWLDEIKNSGEIRENPFFLYIGPHAPHLTATPSEWYGNLFMNESAPRTPTFNLHSANKHNFMSTNPEIDADGIALIDELYRDRLRSLKSVDDIFVAVYQWLNENNLMNETYIIMSSDHGYHLGQFRIGCEKQLPYETDIRVPMFMMGPNIEQNKIMDKITINSDILPTILSLAGIEYDKGDYDGIDIFDNHIKRDTITSQYISKSDENFSACKTWYPNKNDNGTFPGQIIGPKGENNDGQAWVQDSLEYNNWRLIRIINETDNLVYMEFIKMNNRSDWSNNTILNNPYFHEFYDLADDPYQIDNKYDTLNHELQQELHEMLLYFGECKGSKCWSMN